MGVESGKGRLYPKDPDKPLKYFTEGSDMIKFDLKKKKIISGNVKSVLEAL